MNTVKRIRDAAEAIQTADALLVTAGAGMGVDSGLPDFRGKQGFWRAYPAIANLGLSFEEIADPEWFTKDPHLAWAFYGHRLDLYRETTPHQGFIQLLQIGKSKPHGYFVFTSNVDGQFQKAGFLPERIVECHGSIHHFQCTESCTDAIWDAGGEAVRIEQSTFRARDPLPKCRKCAALARPNILMFGDWFWLGCRTEAQHQRFAGWLAGYGSLGEGGALCVGLRKSFRLARLFTSHSSPRSSTSGSTSSKGRGLPHLFYVTSRRPGS